jgi:hypothetical protein
MITKRRYTKQKTSKNLIMIEFIKNIVINEYKKAMNSLWMLVKTDKFR